MKRVIGLVLAVLPFHFWLWSKQTGLPRLLMLTNQITQQQQANKILADNNASLMAEVTNLRSGTNAAEERARYNLGMVKDGEKLYLPVK